MSLTVTEAPEMSVPVAVPTYDVPAMVTRTAARRYGLTPDQRRAIRHSLERLAERDTNRVELVANEGLQAVAAHDIGVRQAVRDALAKLDDGSYGYCETCGAPIPVGRLLAVPYARRYAVCQQRTEDGWDQLGSLIANVVRTTAGEPQGAFAGAAR